MPFIFKRRVVTRAGDDDDGGDDNDSRIRRPHGLKTRRCLCGQRHELDASRKHNTDAVFFFKFFLSLYITSRLRGKRYCVTSSRRHGSYRLRALLFHLFFLAFQTHLAHVLHGDHRSHFYGQQHKAPGIRRVHIAHSK